jgi:HemY protein
MQRLIILLIILAASVYAGLWVMQHPGTITIVMQPWMVEMPLWFGLATTGLLLFLFYLLIDCIDQIHFLWFRFKNWLRFRRQRKLYNKTQHGLALLVEGRWQKAERLLLAGRHDSVDPLMNYLGAARAAAELKAMDRAKEYLHKAREIAPEAELAIGLTQAELEFTATPRKAVETLQRLQKLSPRHPRVLSLLEKAYVRIADWHSLLLLLPALRKAKVLTAAQYAQFEKNVYVEIMQHANTEPLVEVQRLWQDMPRHIRKNPDVIYAYVQQLQRLQATNDIEELIRSALKTGWHAEMVNIYSNLPFVNLNRQLIIAGAWLKMYGDKQELLLALGRLCARIQLYGKAKEYYDRALAVGADKRVLLAYGHLLESIGERDAAADKYRQAGEAV